MECEGLSNLGRAYERPYDKIDCVFEDEESEVEFQYYIPLEIISYIFRFLDAKSLCACSLVCMDWYHLAQFDGYWREFYLKKYGTTDLVHVLKNRKWKTIYSNRIEVDWKYVKPTLESASSPKPKRLEDLESKEYLYQCFLYAGETLRSKAFELYCSEDKSVCLLLLQVAGEQYSSALKLCPDSPEVFLKYGSVLAHCARSINGEESDVLFAVCFSFYAKAAIPSFFMYEHALAIWGDVLVDWAGKKDGQEALIILGKACSKLEEALIVNRDNAMIHFYFGRALHRLATKEKDERKKDLAYLDSISKLQRAAELSPADIYILNEFGATLHEYSMTKTGVEADGLYQRAIDQYARAFELSGSKDAWTLRKWADTYYDWAKSKFCEHYARGQTFSPSDLQAVQTLLKSALEKYEQAIVLDSKYINALNSGALAASTLARLVDDEEEVSRLFGLAYQRFSRAIEASPQDCSIEKCNWAMVLASQAIRQRELAEQKKSFSDFVQRSIQALFEQAKSIIQPLVEKQDKWAYFCMARVCACVGDQFHEDECQRYLIACQDQHFLQKASIWQMTYFDLVKDRDWFKQLKLSQ